MNETDLQALLSHPERPYPSILSVYLSVDQSEPSNQNRGFETQLKAMTASIRSTIDKAAEMERFAAAAHHVQDFAGGYEPRQRGLVMFCDGLDGFFWQQGVGVSLHDQARWNHELFLQPLANVFDQFERYGVVLVDRGRMRLFGVSLGEIEEFTRESYVPNVQPTATDVDWLVQTQKIVRLVLAGASDATADLHRVLPKRLALRVIGAVDAAFDATARDILQATLIVAQEYERSTEVQTVKEIIGAAAGREKTVAGLGPTLKAVNSDRVWQLIYSEGLSTPGFECVKCRALFSLTRKSCAYCGAPVDSVPDIVERTVDHAFRRGAKIEVVTGEAAASLRTIGGIGAFLKMRSAILPA